jgi:hypothetical protein
MRHYSKIMVELPDSDDDPPYAIVNIDCDVCGEEEIRIHVSHIGSLLRVLGNTVQALHRDGDEGSTETLGTFFAPSTPDNKKKVREFLDRKFPGWKADRLRR